MLDTVIIGAGIAGLSAGQYLIENGQSNFVILESGNVIGGRIRTIEFQDKQFSIGPGWLHGQKGNPIFDIIKNIGIEIRKCECDDYFFVWDVKNGIEVTKQYQEKTCILEELHLDVVERVKNIKLDSNQSVLDIYKQYSDVFSNHSDIDKTVIYTTKEIYMGAPMKDLSAKIELQFDQIYNLDEDEINFQILDPMGMTKFVNYLFQKYEEKIKLNNKVVAIEWDETDHVATVVTDENEEFRCKNVIITLQCDLLEKNVIKFQPEIPALKRSAWQHVHAVNYCRLFAKFPRNFWPNKKWLISVIEKVDPFDELILWQNCFEQNQCSADDNILICHFTSGYNRGSSRFDVERTKLIELVTKSMKNMFPETYCEPEDVLFVSHWDKGRFSGAFSVITPGFTEEMIEIIDKSIGPLHFASESVSVELTGTMQAAFVSGRKAAKSTLNLV